MGLCSGVFTPFFILILYYGYCYLLIYCWGNFISVLYYAIFEGSKAMDVIKFRFKILVLGAVGVGRTALEVYVRKLNPHNSDQHYNAESKSRRFATGASFSVLDIDTGDYKVKLLFWVISDDESMRFITPSFIQNAVGAILLYDITNASSITRLPYWLDLLANKYDELPVVLAGNKVDLARQRAITKETGLAFQREHNLTSFMEISMKTGEGVDKVFASLRDLGLIKYLLDEW